MTKIGGFTEKQAELVARAFWRRIYPYRNNYGKELPEECPVEFAANMATALCVLGRQVTTGSEAWPNTDLHNSTASTPNQTPNAEASTRMMKRGLS